MASTNRPAEPKWLRKMGLTCRELTVFLAVSGGMNLVCILLAFLMGKGTFAVIGGLLLGEAYVIGNFLTMAHSIQDLPGYTASSAKRRYLRGYLFRILALIAVLAIGYFYFNLLATAIPVFLSKISYYCFGAVVSTESQK
jgi:hypothetical protein